LKAVSGWSGAIPLPLGLTPRKVTLSLADVWDDNPQSLALGAFGQSVTAILGDPTLTRGIVLTGATPLPQALLPVTQVNVRELSYNEESRTSN
jgi:hypothetical protein